MLVDDGSSTVSLPEVPLLGVLPGTGGLTRLTEDLQQEEITEEMRAAQSPRWVAPIVTWLASRESSDVMTL